MSLIWFLFGLAVGAVFGAKHQAITLYFYEKSKPKLDSIKNKFQDWFAK